MVPFGVAVSRGSSKNRRIARRRSAGVIFPVSSSNIPGVHSETGGMLVTPAASRLHCRSLRSTRIPSICHWRNRAAIPAPAPIRNSVWTAVLSLLATIHSSNSFNGKIFCFGHRSATSLTPGTTSSIGISILSLRDSFPSPTIARIFIAIGSLQTLAIGKCSSPRRLARLPDSCAMRQRPPCRPFLWRSASIARRHFPEPQP